jgi:hypothetical protein
MFSAKDYERIAFRSKRANLSATRFSLRHSVIAFLNDFDCFIDFCLARFVLWREARRERKEISQ